MHVCWCLDVKRVSVDTRALSDHAYETERVRVDTRALSDHAYETELQYGKNYKLHGSLCMHLLHCFHFFSVLYFILSIGDVF